MSNLKTSLAVQSGKTPATSNTLAAMITDTKFKGQLAAALPRSVSPERMARVVLTALRQTPALAECTPQSFMGAVMASAQLGLEPNTPLGHAYLLPYKNRQKGTTDCQLIIGYRGLIDLVRRSGDIASIEVQPVFEGDAFNCKFGLNPNLDHEPDFANAQRVNPAKLRFVYAIARLKDGAVQYDVMSRTEIEAIRRRSRAGESGPWVSDYVEMAKKTVLRRLCKLLPLAIEMASAVATDEAVDFGYGEMEVPQEQELTPVIEEQKSIEAPNEDSETVPNEAAQ